MKAAAAISVVPDAGPARSLDDLAAAINREHDAARGAAWTALEHAVRAGESLLAAREMVERGQWERWIADHLTIHYKTARTYMRLATYKDLVLEQPERGIGAAIASLEGAPLLDGRRGSPWSYGDGMREAALQLRRRGLSYEQCAEALGVSVRSVRNWTAPSNVRKRRAAARRRAARARAAAARRERIAAAARAGGGDLADGYSHLRKALQSLDDAQATAGEPIRGPLNAAIAALHRAEDELGKALRVR